LKPLGLGQLEAAKRLGISLNRLNEIVLGKRGIHRGYGASARTIVENVPTALDASATGTCTKRCRDRRVGCHDARVL
jgi:hypothetical protein